MTPPERGQFVPYKFTQAHTLQSSGFLQAEALPRLELDSEEAHDDSSSFSAFSSALTSARASETIVIMLVAFVINFSFEGVVLNITNTMLAPGRKMYREEILYNRNARKILASFLEGRSSVNESYEIEPRRFKELTKKTKLHDATVARLLNGPGGLVACGLVRHEKDKYFLELSAEEVNEIRSTSERPFRLVKEEAVEAEMTNLEIVSKSTDVLSIQQSREIETLHYPEVRIYGLKKNVFQPSTKTGRSKPTPETSALCRIPKESIFQDKATLGVEKLVQNILNYLIQQKKIHRARVIMKKLKELVEKSKYARVKKLILNYMDFWVCFLSSADQDGHFVKMFYFDAEWSGDTRPIDYAVTADFRLLKSLIPQKEKRLSVKSLQRKYSHFTLIGGKEASYTLVDKLRNLPEAEEELVLDLIDDIGLYLDTEGLSPMQITLVGRNRIQLHY